MVPSYKKAAILTGVGALVFGFGLVVLLCFPLLFTHFVNKEIPIRNGSMSFDMWKDIPLPLYQRFFYFNVTNPNEVQELGAKPILKEIGPYTYRAVWNKTNIVWHPNGTVSYKQVKSYIFHPELSVGKETDVITSVNVPLATTINILNKIHPWPVRILGLLGLDLLRERHIFIRRSIRALTYKGYYDVLTLIYRMLNPEMPDTQGQFAYFYGKNNTDDGEFTVYTGTDDITKLNVINNWNGKSKLSYWRGSTCNMINGTPIAFNPPIYDKESTISVFTSDFCRSYPLKYQKTVKHRDVEAYRYVPLSSVFANGTDFPENSCFATRRRLPSGAMDVSSCKFGAPIVFSFPHFLNADKSYLKAVVGLKPNASIHKFYVDIEPITGIAISLAARLQANVALERLRGFSRFENVPEIIVPAFWQEVITTITPELAELLLDGVRKPAMIATIGSYSFMGVGGLLTIIGFVMSLSIWQNNKKTCSKPDAVQGMIHEVPKKMENGNLIVDATDNHTSDGFTNPAVSVTDADAPSAPEKEPE